MNKPNRRNDRRHALCLIFASDFHEADEFAIDCEFEYYMEFFADEIIGCAISEAGYVLGILTGVRINRPQLDELISKTSDSWDFARISKMDIAIMRLAIYEMLYEDGISHSISVNEAVDMANEFSTDESGKFVNGILGKIMRGLKNGN